MIRNLRLICDKKKTLFMSSIQFTEYIMHNIHYKLN